MIAWVNGNKKTQISDFMPYEIKEEQPQELTTESFLDFVENVNS